MYQQLEEKCETINHQQGKIMSKRKRSVEKRTERNRKKKIMCQERKKAKYEAAEEKQLLLNERIRKLEFENTILKRNVKKNAVPPGRDIFLSCSSRAKIFQSQDKSLSIDRALNFKVVKFVKHDVNINESVGTGVFGNVLKAYVQSIKQVVVVKQLSRNARIVDVIAECKKGMVMAGHKNFPFVFGHMEPNFILLEFIRNSDGTSSPTLKDFLEQVPVPCRKILNSIAVDLCDAIHNLHIRGLLHNDLHPRNILVRDACTVKVIDLGKATLVNDPKKYVIEPGSAQQLKYNTKHLFLAYELRNVPGSYQSVESDVYSLGYNLDLISRHVKDPNMTSVVIEMIAEQPCKRPSISRCITRLKKQTL